MTWFLESTKAKGLRFEILELDKTTMRAKLLGCTGAPFERDISAATLEKYGYVVIKGEKPSEPE